MPFISVLSSLFLFFFPPLITFSFSIDSMDDYDTKEKENFQARNKGRRKFVIREILAHEHVKQIYSEPEDQGYK